MMNSKHLDGKEKEGEGGKGEGGRGEGAINNDVHMIACNDIIGMNDIITISKS